MLSASSLGIGIGKWLQQRTPTEEFTRDGREVQISNNFLGH